MAEKGIRIVISAKAAVREAIAKATAQLKAFAKSAAKVAKSIAAGFAAAAAGIIAFGAKCVQAYGVQEKAERALMAAHRAFGEEAAKLLEAERKMAAAIQDETAVGDENVLGMMARLRMLGVVSEQLGAAAKATVALMHAGMAEERAVKAVAAAYAGNYDALKPLIPALREVTDEGERAKLVNDFLTRQYGATREELGTLEGAWKALKGRIGDALEVIGRAIVGGTNLKDVMGRVGDRIKGLADRFSEWLDAGGIQELQMHVEIFAASACDAFEKVLEQLGLVRDMVASLVDGFVKAYKWARDFGTFVAQWKSTGKRPDQISGSYARAEEAVWTELERFGVKKAETLEEKVAAIRAKYADKAAKDRIERAKKTEAATTEIAIAGIDARAAAERKAEEEKAARDKEAEARAKKREQLMERERQLVEELAREEAAKAEEKRLKALRDEIDALKQQIQLNEELARKPLPERGGREKEKGFGGGGVGADGVAGNWDDEKALERAKKLEEREGRGVRLSRRNQAWLDTWRGDKQAAENAKKAAELLAAREKALREAEIAAANKRAEEIKRELVRTRTELNRLLTVQ